MRLLLRTFIALVKTIPCGSNWAKTGRQHVLERFSYQRLMRDMAALYTSCWKRNERPDVFFQKKGATALLTLAGWVPTSTRTCCRHRRRRARPGYILELLKGLADLAIKKWSPRRMCLGNVSQHAGNYRGEGAALKSAAAEAASSGVFRGGGVFYRRPFCAAAR
jgi:hypothetical protein